MNPVDAPERALEESLRRLGERVIAAWRASGARQASGPSLLIFNPAAPCPESGQRDGAGATVALRLASTSQASDLCWNTDTVARTSSESLPVQSSSLGEAMLCHVVTRGEEPELAEACRALRPGACLLVLGLNRFGLRYLRGRKVHGLPGMSPLAVRRRLETLEMNVVGLLAAGFMGMERPRTMTRGLARILIPFADLYLIVARPMEPRIMNPLPKKAKMRAVGAPSALAGR